ncbi:MAG TPA: hypothetical protein VFM96_13280 [Gaiellaceae bacterium]|nr:hypothetical protein [Gaiellaceae bacterium]
MVGAVVVAVGASLAAFTVADGHAGKPLTCNGKRATKHRPKCPVASGHKTGGTPATTTPATTTPTTTTIGGTTFTFGGEVAPAAQSEVEKAIAAAESFVQSRMGVATSAFNVFGYGDIDEFLAAYSQHFGSANLANLRSTLTQIQQVHGGYAETNVGVIFLWTASTPADRSLGLTMAHEYFHVIQLQLSPQSAAQPPDRVRTNGPEWLAEGSAEYVGQQVAGNYASTLAAAISRTRTERPDLSKLETPTGFRTLPNPFPVCMAAVDLLVKEAGTASLAAFWQATGRGTPWQQAFQQAFGRTSSAFYAEFAAADES